MLTPEWRKSSYSNGQASCVQVKGVWRKSSYSNGQANCVEVRGQAEAVDVRDSKDPGGPALSFGAVQWAAFTEGIKLGEFDL